MIVVSELQKSFDSNRVLNGISFEVKTGEVLGFLGPNGAGKTTTMRMLTGFLAPSSGVVTINGKNVAEHALAAREHIGYLPENNPLYDTMRMYEYLEFIAGVKQIPNAREEIARVVKICSLQEKIAESISDLSKGYRQRVGLAAALLGDPDVLILDEPTSGLDPNQALQIREVIREIGKTKTIIFSTHILQEVQAVCDRAIIINHGKIVAAGTVDELMNSAQGQSEVRAVIEGSVHDVVAGLASIPHVEEVKHVHGHEFVVHVSGKHDVRKEIFQLCVAETWVLLEMQQSQVSLEDIFRQLTSQ
ncbi:MAG: ATP-binding cassette domain-containing protein [Candidatus Kerfeldbacteria bacterium]|nr:ATP-binding cassette domain-containing protein [Candidatus Kerfeldbacteria bacterium]